MTVNSVSKDVSFARSLGAKMWIWTFVFVLAMAATLAAQTTARPRITQEISRANMVTLHGNVRADVKGAPDLGAVEDGMELRLYLVLQRSPEQQTALDNLLARQQQPTAAEYHKWLTPQQFGAQFGAAKEDIAKITNWLEAQGIRVNGVMNNNMFIDFTTSAGRVRDVFGTQLHYYNLQGGKYPANAQDPQIPAALAGVVSGIKGLSKVPPQTHRTKTHKVSFDATTHSWHRLDAATPAYNNPYGPNGTNPPEYDITPKDYYTIYNANSVFNGGNLGANATIAVIEESDIEYGTVDPTTHKATGGDVADFRNLFGVPGTFNMLVYHGYGTVGCADPGIDPNNTGEEVEAALDAEWANALAPSSTLIFMSCVYNNTGNGIFDSMAALVDNNLSDVMSMSYGSSELNYVAVDYSSQDTIYAEAAALGQSIIISTGDSGSDVADQNVEAGSAEYCSSTSATTADPTGTAVCGINVSGFSSSPMVTAAGGTDFADEYDNYKVGLTQSTYWGANGANYNDALGYVPETTWNDSCASSILALLQGSPGVTYCGLGPGTAKNPINPYITGDVVGGSGGFSTHYAVPSYQSNITGYSGTKRAQPDVSMFAGNGFWNHALILCDSYALASDPNAGQSPCTLNGVASPGTFGAAGGTSFVAPALAGVGGLLVSSGGRQGLLNPALYALAKTQFTASATKTACYSNGQTSNTGTTTGLPASSCIFNDVTTGNNDVPCAAGSASCYVSSGTSYGMLSLTGSGSLSVAYPATVGYDAATGIGTLNIANLISKWNTAFNSTTGLTASPTTISTSQSTNLTATVTGGVPAGSTYTPPLNGKVNFTLGTTTLGSCTLSGSSCSLSVAGSQLAVGSNSVSATFVGSTSYPSSTSSLVTVNVTGTLGLQSLTTISVSPSTVTINGTVTLTSQVSSATTGTPTGTVTFYNGTTPLGSATISSGTAVLSNLAVTTAHGFTAGTDSLTAVYNGDSNFATSTSSASVLTVNVASTTTTASASANPVAMGNALTITATVVPSTATGTVKFTSGTTTLGTATLANGTAAFATTASVANGFAVGAMPITATYSGDGNDATSNGSFTLTVNKGATTITVSAPSSVNLGASVTLTAIPTPAAATGNVTFKSGANTVGTATLSGGSAALTIAATTANGFTMGSNSITAVYAGDSNYNGSTSSAWTLTITNPTTITVTPTPTSIALGDATAKASYAVTVTGGGTPTGTVALTIGGVSAKSLGTVTLTNGTATLSSIAPTTGNGFTVGSDTITATYTPTTGSSFGTSTGTATQTVTAPAYTITPSATSISLAKGNSQAVTITLASTTYADTTTWSATTSSSLITVSPSSGTLALAAGGNSGAINLQIMASSSAANHAPRMPWTGGMIAFGAVLAIPLARRRKRVAAVLLTALAISTLGFMMACGGGGASGPRSYTVTIKGTGGVSSTIAVTVK